jgi:hypothetical protein
MFSRIILAEIRLKSYMSTQNLEELKILLNLKCFTKVYGKRYIFAG